MEITTDSIRDQIPPYLTAEQQAALLRELNNFGPKTQYYIKKYETELLQGDGWTKLKYRDFGSGELTSTLGIILTNTCDMAPENKRDLPAQIIFSPIAAITKFEEVLRQGGINEDRISQYVADIKAQKLNNILFLPKGSELAEDCMALLGIAYTIPVNSFLAEEKKEKLFTFSMIGFYLFIFKLSVHFCRLKENVGRNSARNN